MDEKEDRKKLLLNRYEWSKNWRRPWDDKWLRWYKLFRGAVPTLPKGSEDRSNLHIPRTYSTVDTVRSKILTACFANRPWISFVPHAPDDVDNSKNMESLVDFQLEKGESFSKFYNLVTDMLIYGGCPFEVGWKYQPRIVKQRVPTYVLGILTGYQEIETEVPDWDDPDWQPFMIDDLFVDPEGTDIDSCQWVIRRRYMTEKEIRDKEKRGIFKVSDWDSLKAATESINEGKQNRLAVIGAAEHLADAVDVGARRFEVLEMWEDDRVTTLVNQKEIVRDGKKPFEHGKKPFGFAKFDPVSGEFYGISLVEIIEYLQRELNTTRNQRIDAVALALHRMWMARKGVVAPEDLAVRPGGIVWVEGEFNDLIKELAFTPPPREAYQEESVIKSDMEDASATYGETRGAPSETKKTATENVIRDRSVALRFDVKAKLFEQYGLKRLGFFYDQLNQQFIDSEVTIRLKDPEAGYRWVTFMPEQLQGTYEYQPAGSALDATLDAVNYRDNLLALYDRFKEDPEIQTHELKKRVIEAYGIKDAEKLLKTAQELQQEALLALQGGGGIGENVQGQVPTVGFGGQVPAASGQVAGPQGGI